MPTPSDARREANRAAAPVIAAWWDGWSAVFTFDAIDLTDPTTGRRWRRGDMTPDTGRSMNADEWLAYVNDPNPRPLGVQA